MSATLVRHPCAMQIYVPVRCGVPGASRNCSTRSNSHGFLQKGGNMANVRASVCLCADRRARELSNNAANADVSASRSGRARPPGWTNSNLGMQRASSDVTIAGHTETTASIRINSEWHTPAASRHTSKRHAGSSIGVGVNHKVLEQHAYHAGVRHRQKKNPHMLLINFPRDAKHSAFLPHPHPQPPTVVTIGTATAAPLPPALPVPLPGGPPRVA